MYGGTHLKVKKKKRRSRAEKPPLVFPEGINLDSPTGLLSFMHQVMKDIYESKLNSRQAGAMNGAIRNLMEAYGMDNWKLKEVVERIERLENTPGSSNTSQISRIPASAPASSKPR